MGTSSTMAFVQLNDLRIFLYSERRNEKYHQVTVTHSMWSFWGWAEQFDCSDSSLYHVYKYSMVGIRRWQNPNCYHYCQNPTMVGFWLVGICWLAVVMVVMVVMVVLVVMVEIIQVIQIVRAGTCLDSCSGTSWRLHHHQVIRNNETDRSSR